MRKKMLKIAGAACVAAGVVVLSAVVASGVAARAVAEGFKSARNTMKKILKGEAENSADGTSPEESTAWTSGEGCMAEESGKGGERV